MRKRKRLAFWLTGTVLAFAVAGIVVVRMLGLTGAASALDEQLRLARREGLAVEPADLARSPVPDDQNAAHGLLEAFSAAKLLPGNPLKIVADFNSTKVHDDRIRKSLNALQPTLDTVVTSVQRPRFHLNWDWNKGYDLQRQEADVIDDVTKLDRCLRQRAHFEGLDGQREGAIRSIIAAARLDRLLAEETTVYCYLARINIERGVLNEAEDLIRRFPGDAQMLQAAELVVTALGPLPDIRAALGHELVMERIFLHVLPNWHESRSTIHVDSNFAVAAQLLKLKSLSDRNEANLVAETRRIYADLPRDGTDLSKAMRSVKGMPDNFDPEPPRPIADLAVYRMEHLLPEFKFGRGSLDAYAQCVARRRVFLAGIDILMQKSRTGAFPAGWAKAGPDGIDPFTDKPLTYHRTRDGFVVYSFDEDRKDDGGRSYRQTSGSGTRQDISFEYPTLSVDPTTKR